MASSYLFEDLRAAKNLFCFGHKYRSFFPWFAKKKKTKKKRTRRLLSDYGDYVRMFVFWIALKRWSVVEQTGNRLTSQFEIPAPRGKGWGDDRVCVGDGLAPKTARSNQTIVDGRWLVMSTLKTFHFHPQIDRLPRNSVGNVLNCMKSDTASHWFRHRGHLARDCQ